MMCKQVLPIGMLGLMLASMVFATASSVNTTLNMSAAVVTNDLYKTRYPNASAKETMRFARMITVVFGLGAVAVAMMVPGMGGIVEAVLSVGAIAGVPLLAPPIWALFSKRISGKDIVSVTIISLVINLFFKFITPWLFDLKFDRATEMAVGTIVPMGMLLILEIWAALDGKISHQYIVYLNKLSEHTSVHVSTMEKDSRDENTYAFRVLGFTLLVLGLLIGGLGIMAGEGRVYVLIISMLIISGGIWLRFRAS
jgi:Na+/proline symporter